MTCESCHAGMGSSESAWGSMSGEHRKHLQENFDCGECHLEVTSDGLTIATPTLHVNGQPDLQFSEDGFAYSPGSKSCTGSCHGENHNNDGW